MSELTQKLNTMTEEELSQFIEEDSQGDAPALFALESELLETMGQQLFPESRTYRDMSGETDAERCVRVLIESMDFRGTLEALSALGEEGLTDA